MSHLIALARETMNLHGWSTEVEARLAKSRLHFDLVAENDAAIVFMEALEGEALGARARALSSEVAAVTLQQSAGVKAWEAYLLLLVTQGYAEAQTTAQELQRDLTYCRKIVIDGEAILNSEDSQTAMEAALSFLFPFDAAATNPHTEDVRGHLIDLIAQAGIQRDLVMALVNSFDSEAECRCWDRVIGTVESLEVDEDEP